MKHSNAINTKCGVARRVGLRFFSILGFIVYLFLSIPAASQGLSGPESVTVNESHNYVFFDDYILANPIWSVSGGSVTNYWQSGAYYYATVLWNTVGTGSVQFRDGSNVLGTLSIDVNGASGPPSAPLALAANLIQTASFTANWEYVSGATGYRLDVSTTSAFSNFVSGYNNLSVTPNNIQVTGLTGGTTYYYRVRAVNSYGTSANSNTITVLTLPNPPTATAATNATASSFTANWGSVPSATSYRLDVSTNSSFSSFVAGYNNLTVTGTSHTLTGLSTFTVYYYRVRAVNGSGTTAHSNTITIITSTVPPEATSATAFTASSFQATWNLVTGAVSYQLDVSTTNTFSSFVSGYNNLSVNGTNQNVSGLTPGTTYYYRVRTVNSSGSVSANSGTVQSLTLPAAPELNSASSVAAYSFTVSWTSVVSASSYRLDVSTVNNFVSFVEGYNGFIVNGTSHNVTGLAAGNIYYFRVRAVNSSGQSANSSTGTQLTAPSQPVPSSATAITSNSFTANWNPVNSATSYRLDVSTTNNFVTFVPGFQDLLVNGTSKVVTPLETKEATYFYRVRAVNAGGTSVSSSVILAVNLRQNYVKKTAMLVAGITNQSQIDTASLNQKSESYTFYDGLGRPSQTIAKRQSPNQLDIIQPVAYDEFGRESVKYLPYASGSDGWYKLEFISKENPNYTSVASPQFQFYQNTQKLATDDRPYAETFFEPSPLNRPLKDYGSGVDWSTTGSNKFIEHQYLFNTHGTSSGQEKIIAWKINNNLPVRSAAVTDYVENSGYYSSGQLSIKVTKDEHGNSIREYTTKTGQVILKKVQVAAGSSNLNSASDWALTYYVYDDIGNLRFVLPPELSKLIHQNDTYNPTSVDIGQWAFIYRFDGRNRMIVKKVPGADSVYMVYDNRDRLVLTQDGLQRTGNRWSFTKYDEINRPVLTGIRDTSVTLSQAQMQTVVNAHFAKTSARWGETYIGSVAGNVHGYSNKAYPVRTGTTTSEIDPNKYLTVTYYDNYDFRTLWHGAYTYVNEGLSEAAHGINYQQPTTEWGRVIGHVTGTKTKVLDGGNTGGFTWLKAVTYYDDKYRVVQVVADNYKGGTDRITNVYDFTGKVLKTKTTHAEQDILWKDGVGVQVTGNKLSRTVGGNGWTQAGAVSVQQVPAGQNCWVEAVATGINQIMVGLADTNPDLNYTSIDFAAYLNGTTLAVYENGTNRGNVGTLVAGDVVRVERTGTTVKYYKNGILVYTSTVSSNTLLFVDASIYTANASLVGVRSSFGGAIQTITRRFTYDHAGRLINTFHQLNSGPEILLSSNEYNELGQLIDKKLHSTNGTSFKQSVDYRYNIRGWLTKVNESDLSGGDAGDPADLFGMQLAYNTDLGTGNSDNLQFNGNISAIKWSNALGLSNIKENAYNFTYDPLNRLKAANFKEKTTTWNNPTNNAFAESGLNYDLNGNITSLTRNDKRASGWMDNLTYTYTGNQLVRVTDNGDDYLGFIDGQPNGSNNDYTYDVNGNMTRDLNKGIGTSLSDNTNIIKYNFLNLPETVTKGNNTITYIYDATGRKLSQVTSFGGQVKQTDYAGEFQYENDALQFISHEEGRIVVAKTEATFTHDGSALTGVTASTSTVALVTQNGNQTYVRATANGTTAKQGLFPIGGTISVQPGEQYRIRVKGYRTGSSTVHIYIRTNGIDLNWPGSLLANGLAAEAYTEQVVTIPAGHTTMQAGVVWNTVTAGQQFFMNDFEIVKLTATVPEYQYYLKDHLGNTRLTFTSKVEQESATATLETANQTAEQGKFIYYDEAVKVNSTLFDHTNAGTTFYSTRLNGTANERTGLAKSLSVMPGDTVKIEVYAKYLDPNSSNWTTALTNFMAAIAGGTAPPGTVVDGGAAGSTGGATDPNAGILNKNSETGPAPKAYLNYIVFDRNFVPLLTQSGFKRITTSAREYGQDGPHDLLKPDQPLVIREAGYVYIYLSNDNETAVEVFFDDFTVEHIKSPVVQMDDYYPFGLTFNSYSRENSLLNKWKFQGQEHIDDLDLGWDSFKWRNHQPDIGRFFNVDPIAEDYYYNSPYAFAENRVIDGNELEGLEWKSIHDDKNKTTVNVVTVKVRNISSRSNVEAMGVAMDIASQSEKSFSGRDADGNSVITKVSLDFESEIKEGDFFMELRDNIQLQDGSTVTTVLGIPALGRVDEIGNTQENRVQVNIGSLDRDRADIVRSGAHELGHTGGLNHESSQDNLMKQGGDGTKVTPEQRKIINDEIKRDTKGN